MKHGEIFLLKKITLYYYTQVYPRHRMQLLRLRTNPPVGGKSLSVPTRLWTLIISLSSAPTSSVGAMALQVLHQLRMPPENLGLRVFPFSLCLIWSMLSSSFLIIWE